MTRLRIVKKDHPEPLSETRARIISAAVRLFSRQGYHKTTIADLATAIGQTSGAIFHHFAGKEDLLHAVVDWLARGLKAYSDVAKRTENGSHQILEETVRVMREHYQRNPEATICLVALATEFAGSNNPIEERLKEAYEVFIAAFAHSLRNHPQVRDPRAAAIVFLGSVQGVAIQGLLRENEYSIDTLSETFLAMLSKW